MTENQTEAIIPGAYVNLHMVSEWREIGYLSVHYDLLIALISTQRPIMIEEKESFPGLTELRERRSETNWSPSPQTSCR